MFAGVHLWSHLVLGFCLFGVLKSQIQFQYWQSLCSYFLFLPGSVLADCPSLWIYSFPPGCLFHRHAGACIDSSLTILCISVVSVVTSPFHVWFYWFGPSPFFSWWVCQFFFFFKEPAFIFIDLFYSFLSLYFIYFCSDLYDFFPSINFRFYVTHLKSFLAKGRIACQVTNSLESMWPILSDG